MKTKRLILIPLLILAVKSSIGQKKSKLEYGLEAGPGLASIRGNEIIDKYHKAKIGYSAGLFLQYNFKKVVSIHVGLAYENKGSKIEGQAFDSVGFPIGISKGRTIAQYLVIPVLVRASFGTKRMFFINAGPYFALLLKNQSKASGSNSLFASLDNTKNFKKSDLGISFGAGATIPVTHKFNFLIEARDNLGLSNTSAVPVYNNGDIKYNTFNLLLGISFKVGG